jgi:hypothetical protein
MIRTVTRIGFAVVVLLCATAPHAAEVSTPAAPSSRPATTRQTDAAADVQTRGSVRRITLPEFEPDLPAGASRNTVVVACGACHSTRYITNQPPLSRETWVAEVTKMRKTYGAPVAEDRVNEIVDYCFAVRGAQ